LVRDAALLLSSNRSLAEVFDDASALLTAHIDASIVLIFLQRAGELRCEYANVAPVAPDASVIQVFHTGAPGAFPSALFVPIVFGGTTLGVLSAQSPLEDAYHAGEIALLEACSLYLGARIIDEERREASERFKELATTDALTGIANRRGLSDAVEREWLAAKRHGHLLSFIILDIDLFKQFNDRYGHVVGDACLQQVARACADVIRRSGDVLARYGGEEFCAVLPETPLSGAIELGEEIRAAIEHLAIPHEGSSLGRVSVSIGVATLLPRPDLDPEALVQTADRLLYEAKAAGRNRVCADGYVSPAPRVHARQAVSGNLPAPRTNFVGREREIELLAQAVFRQPLSTIVGPGGVGKTRLALEVASRVIGQFSGGAWLVDLTPLGSGDDPTPLLASTLRNLVPPNASIEGVGEMLRERNVLLVIDNCEHVVELAADVIDRLLERAPNLRIIATSREALGVDGEFVLRMGPLDAADAVTLFVDRADAAGVVLDAQARASLPEIVAQLDGIPLAIELAAPRLSSMSLSELREGLGDRLELLRASSRRGPTRQQTLRALLDWSYRLLTPAEQTLFRRLAIFAAGWTLEAMLAVCGDDALDRRRLRTAFENLVAKSLVIARTRGDTARFDMLETTREYAVELLTATDEAPELIRRHIAYFESFSLELSRARENVPTTSWNLRITEDRRNLKAAIEALFENEEWERAARMHEALADWYFDRAYFYAMDQVERMNDVFARQDVPPRARHAIGLNLAATYRQGGKATEARVRDADDALAFFRELGDERMIAVALRARAALQFHARGAINDSLREPLEEAIERAVARGEHALASDMLLQLGILHTQSMDDARLALALAAFDRAIVLREARGDGDCCASCNGNAGDVAFYMGDLPTAIARARRAIALVERKDEVWLAGLQHLNLGHFSIWAKDFTTARVALRKAYEGLQAGVESYAAASVFEKFAQLGRHVGEYSKSTQLLAYADRLLENTQGARQRREAAYIEELRAELQRRLGADFARHYALGRTARIKETLAIAESL
jgi:non-specific serine/threonine protein kinase